MKIALPKKLHCYIILIALFYSVSSFAQDGSLDASFGNGGKVITDFGGPKDFATCMALQTDNKIIVGGYVTLVSKQYFALARYQTNGSPDSSFGTNGKVTTGFSGITAVFLESMKLQVDGKIVAGGYLLDGVNNDFVLVRYKTDGSLDSTFGTNGILITALNGNNNRSTSIEIEPDGTIIVAGKIDCKPAVRRYESNGATSLFFAQAGIATPGSGNCYDVNSMFIVALTGVVITGQSDGTIDNMFLMKLNTSGQGSLDSSFGTNGLVKTTISDTSGVFASLGQPDGKIIVAGFDAATSSNRQFVVARYQTTGSLDSSFGTNGEVRTTFSTGSATAYSLALASNGNIIVTGSLKTSSTDEIVLLVLDSTGKANLNYGTNGEVVTGNASGDYAVASVIQPDGKLVVAGYTLSADSTGYNFIVARYNTQQSLPIKLSSFTASAGKNAVVLNWVTATELNNSYFAIERKGNTSSFTAIGTIAGKGNSSQSQAYTFTDIQPLQGDNFYRLKQVDKDGKFTYSNIVRVGFGVTMPYIQVYPNPSKNTAQVNGLVTGAELSIVDMAGRSIQKAVASGNNYTLNVQSLSPGIYFIRVNQGNKTTVLKLLKE